MHTLFDLQPGQQGVIQKILGDGRLKLRLAEMGFVRGAEVTAERSAPFGDPRSYLVRGYHVGLRNQDARSIVIMPGGA
jgi:Fe2+ transport system protein FeoA